MKKQNKRVLENRLRVDEELICYNGRDLYEKVKVIEVNKAEKTAKLSNMLVISRYPNTKTGFFKVMIHTQYSYKVCRLDHDFAKIYTYTNARKRISNILNNIQIGILNRTSVITKSSQEDLNKLLEIDELLSKIK